MTLTIQTKPTEDCQSWQWFCEINLEDFDSNRTELGTVIISEQFGYHDSQVAIQQGVIHISTLFPLAKIEVVQ